MVRGNLYQDADGKKRERKFFGKNKQLLILKKVEEPKREDDIFMSTQVSNKIKQDLT